MSGRIKKLIAYLPQFESGEEPTTDNWFMDFYHLATEECKGINYQPYIDHLTNVDFIQQANLAELKGLLLAVCRSEYWMSGDYTGHVWREFNQRGVFTAILRRLTELEKGDK